MIQQSSATKIFHQEISLVIKKILSGNVFTFFIFHITNVWYLVFKTLIIMEKLILKPTYKNQNVYHITSLVINICNHNM